jgi:hypothetical protein
MAEKVNCFITKSNEGEGAYAVRADNDLNVYIPKSVADAAGLEEFDEIIAIVVKNDRETPPWKAIKVSHVGA